jgi:hypothetical protein
VIGASPKVWHVGLRGVGQTAHEQKLVWCWEVLAFAGDAFSISFVDMANAKSEQLFCIFVDLERKN